jgi:hypothetical protein
MRRLISFLVTLFMPLILIGAGGALAGWGLANEWEIVAWSGLGLIGAGIAWGLFLFLWATDGPL